MKRGLADTYPYKPPFLSKPADDDLTKQWVVEYGIWHVNKNRVVRKRVVLTGTTLAARRVEAAMIIAELTALLKDGTAFNGDLVLPKPEPRLPAPQTIVARLLIAEETHVINLPIVTAVNDYLAFVKQKLSKNTWTGYRTSLYSLLDYLNRHEKTNLRLGHFDSVHAITWLDEITTVEKNANRTRNNRFNDGSIFFNHYISRERPPHQFTNPFEGISALPCLKHKHQSYSKQQQTAYRDGCNALGLDQLLLYCRFIYYTLARPHEEIRRLRIRDIRDRIIYIEPENAKTSEGDYIDIPAPLAGIINQHKLRTYPGHYFVFSYNDEPGPDLLGPKYLYRRHVKVLKRINLADTNHDLYSWKHTGAVALWEATNDIELVRKQCRHSDIKQTIEYLRDLGIYAVNDKINQFPEF